LKKVIKKLFIFFILTVNNFIIEKLNKKGFDSLRILGKNLRQVSSYNGYNKIKKDQFLAVLRDMDILLPKANSEVRIKNMTIYFLKILNNYF